VELRRRLSQSRMKRSHRAHLPQEKMLRAAADLCRVDVRSLRWDDPNLGVAQACEWHTIGPSRPNLASLKELRREIFNLGHLESLIHRRGLEGATTEDKVLFHNLQLLLQTPVGDGAHSRSRPASAVGTIAVAVYLERDATLDVKAALVACGAPESNLKGRLDGVRMTRERIATLGLLDLDHRNRIDPLCVDRVRDVVKVSVADAARAVLNHGSNVDAAVAELRDRLGLVCGDGEVVDEAEGLQLHLSERSAKVRYVGVSITANGRAFEASVCESGRRLCLGEFATATAAAVAYARHWEGKRKREEQRKREVGARDDGRGGGVDGVGEGEEEAEAIEEAEAEEEDDVVDEDEYKEERDDAGEGWVRIRPVSAVGDSTATRQKAFNASIEPLLGDPASPHASGVVALSVSAEHASCCAAFLAAHWRHGSLLLPGCTPSGSDCAWMPRHSSNARAVGERPTVVDGYSSYGKVIEPHNAEEQRLNTLLMTNARLPACRKQLPGFAEMELELADWLHRRFGTVVELFFAHGLRQSPETLRSTGFAVHQDTEEFDFIEYSVVVKLTQDEPGEPPSAMRVVGAPCHFEYGPSAGASGCFRSRLHHASVEPKSTKEHLKIAYFFRTSKKGERRAKRTLGGAVGAGGGAGGEADDEMAQRRKIVSTELGSYILGAAPELLR
jgi:hypothetical protein